MESTNSVHEKEGWVAQDVYQLPRIEQDDGEQPLPASKDRRFIQSTLECIFVFQN